jgi:hypothetical protein
VTDPHACTKVLPEEPVAQQPVYQRFHSRRVPSTMRSALSMIPPVTTRGQQTDVIVDGARGQEQARGNLSVAQAGTHEVPDLAQARGKG